VTKNHKKVESFQSKSTFLQRHILM